MDMKELGRVLKARREELGLTQGAMADRLEITQSYVSAWEIGKPRHLTRRMLENLAAAYEVDCDLLARAAGYVLPPESLPDPEEEQRALARMLPTGMTRQQREAVAAYARYIKDGRWFREEASCGR